MDAPADLKEWLERADGLPLPPSVPHGERAHWRPKTRVCFGHSTPINGRTFTVATGEAVTRLWENVRQKLADIPLARDCNVALPALCFEGGAEGLVLRAQTMITWSEPVGPPVRDDVYGEFEVELATS